MSSLNMFERVLVIIGISLLAIAVVGVVAMQSLSPRNSSTSYEQKTERVEQTQRQDIAKDARKIIDDRVGGATFYKSVRNDKTGNWRCYVYYSSDQAQDIAAEYYHAYFENKDEVHVLVNLALKTTASLTYGSGHIYVDVFEYTDGEEHDAIAMCTGMPLASYIVNASTGEIEKI